MIFRKNIVSDCCSAPILEDSIFCNNCGEPCRGIKECETCGGTGKVDILDERRVNSTTISPPYKTIICPDCDGEGFCEVEL